VKKTLVTFEAILPDCRLPGQVELKTMKAERRFPDGILAAVRDGKMLRIRA
jgi:hypothetical protein